MKNTDEINSQFDSMSFPCSLFACTIMYLWKALVITPAKFFHLAACLISSNLFYGSVLKHRVKFCLNHLSLFSLCRMPTDLFKPKQNA